MKVESQPTPASRNVTPDVRSSTAIEEFIRSENAGAVLLFVATVVALAWANSSQSASYFAFWRRDLGVTLGGISFAMDLRHWIDDGLMSVFFLVVGLEIKREIVKGELSSWNQAALPAIAAIGGMLVPAVIYFALNRYGEAVRGWAIPMATDIGFALGALALLGRRIPSTLRVFLLALAIIDDLGAILVIAIFYTQHISPWAIGIALVLFAVLAAISSRVREPVIYVLLSLAFWAAVLKSGVHPTIAGVALGLLVPVKPRCEISGVIPYARRLLEKLLLALQSGEREMAAVTLSQLQTLMHATESPAERLERRLHPWVSFVILPVFALVNAGIMITADEFRSAIVSPAALGIFLGLTVGKLAGVAGSSFLAVRLGLAPMPDGTHGHHLVGVGMITGIGFTIALFVSGLAFETESLQSAAKMAILAASLVSGLLGYTYLRLVYRRIGA